jgi:anti-sigma factor RsiW
MFDFLRNLTQSGEEKRQERLSAYLDDALTPGQRSRFEEELAADATLRQELRQMQAVKRSLGELPRLRAPRTFTLDPAKYGRPAPQPAIQLYPVVRVATAITAIMLIVSFLVPLLQDIGLNAGSAADEAIALESAVAVTRVVTETQVEEMEMAAEEAAPAAAQMAVEAEVVVEEAAEAEAMEEAEAPAAEEEPRPAEGDLALEASPLAPYPAPPQPTPAPLATAGFAQAPQEAD